MTEPRTDSFEEWWKKKIKKLVYDGYIPHEDAVELLGEDRVEGCYAEDAWNASREQAEKKIEILNRALEYYADYIQWDNKLHGKKARLALAEIKELK